MKSEKEKLLVELIHFLSDKFKDRIVLEGGMLLRLLNSPRSTQDIDCFLISKESKKVLAGEIKSALLNFRGAKVTAVSVNSRGIFIDLEGTDPAAGKIMLEISVVESTSLPSKGMTTVSLSNQYALSGRVVSTVALPEAFANKIAACIERKNMRDLYDIGILEPLCTFDLPTLKKRLANVSMLRQKTKKMTPKEAALVLKKRAESLKEKDLKDELYPLIPPEQQPGLLQIIKAAIFRVIGQLENLD